MKKILLIIITPLLIQQIAFSQNLDSLEQCLTHKDLPTSELLTIYDELSWSYNSIDPLKAKHYAYIGIQLARKCKDKKMEAILLRNLGVAAYMFSEIDSAENFLKEALIVSQKIKDENLQNIIIVALANLYNYSGNFQLSLDYYLQAITYMEKHNKYPQLRIIYGNIGSLYNNLKNYEQANTYFDKAIDIALQINDSSGLAQAYDGKSQYYLNSNEPSNALKYSKLSASIFHSINEAHNEAISIQTLAMIYYKYFNDYTNAEHYALEALSLTQQLNIPSYIASSYNMLSNVYYNTKRFKESEETALKAIEIDTTDTNIYANMIANIAISNIYLGNKEKAVSYFNHYTNLINYRANANFQKAISELEIKYQTEAKQKTINELLYQKKLYGIITISYAIILLLLLLIIYLRYIAIKNKRKLAEQKLLDLEQKTKLIAAQATIDGELSERTRLASDLHDGLGGLLSALRINLYDIKKDVIRTEDDVLKLNKTEELLNNSSKELQRIIHNMMPRTLLRLGINAAIQDFCKSISNVHLYTFGEEIKFEAKFETTIYHIILELINNALKHSNATNINVQIIYQEEQISITVHDDGIGFDSLKSENFRGLNNIKQRVVAFNGKLDIYSQINKGTEITIIFNNINKYKVI